MKLLRMNLPTEKVFPSGLVGGSEGGGSGEHAVLANSFTMRMLDSSVHRDLRWCPNCAGQKLSLEIFEFENGILACCQGCGEEQVIRFSRTVSGVAS